MKIGFDNDKYLTMQSEHIRDRISKFDNKLYLEFGGKLFDDYHASRVLPGFEPDSKLRMLMQLSDQAEIVIVISAADIDKNKMRGDLGITYDEDVLRLIDAFTERGLYVGSVCITRYAGQESADHFKKRLEKLGIKVYFHYSIPGYPSNIPLIVSDEGYGKKSEPDGMARGRYGRLVCRIGLCLADDCGACGPLDAGSRDDSQRGELFLVRRISLFLRPAHGRLCGRRRQGPSLYCSA